jgi:hypothetical protein
MGCLRCRILASPVEAVSLKISEAAVESVSLKFSEAARAVCAVECMRHPWKQFWLKISEAQGLFTLSNPCVTRGSSFVEDF